MFQRLSMIIPLAALLVTPATAETFRFEAYPSLDAMRAYVIDGLPLGTTRDVARQIFVNDGGAMLHQHPARASIEKYTYNINLCRLHVWRWNISANFDSAGKLTPAYINGEPAFPAGDPARTPETVGYGSQNAAILQGTKPRPEADRGESSVSFLLLDIDRTSDNVDDGFVAGVGPSRADPANMGRAKAYTDVEHWRSIFDDEGNEPVAEYTGRCPG